MAAKAIKFRGRLSFPITTQRAANFTQPAESFDPERLTLLYVLNESGNGGWYPIGAAQTWHNGIHLSVPAGTPVRTIARGTIIAARLSTAVSKEKFEFGTASFVLIKHTLDVLENPEEPDHNAWTSRAVEFYSLYMHVDLTPENSADVPWFQTFLPFLKENTCSGDILAKINVAEDGRTKNEKTGLNCRTAPVKKGKKLTPGTFVAVIPRGTIVEVSNEAEEEWKRVNVPSMNLTGVWVYGEGNRLVEVKEFEDQLQAFQSEGCAKLNYPVESGEIIGHVGVIRPAQLSRAEFSDVFGLHLELFAAKNIIHPQDMKAWTLVEDDTDDDIVCEFQALTKKVQKPGVMAKLGWDTSEFASVSEISTYYKTMGDADKKWLRGMITRNTSYWSIDWDKMTKSNDGWTKEFECSERDVTIANQYMWWEECEKIGVDLPSRTGGKALVYHYHPFTLMKYIHDHLPPSPIFYVKRGNEELVVGRPPDINIAATERVWVYEPGATDWLLGRGAALQGCQGIGNFGETTLYEALIKPASTPAVPTLGSASRHIWASIWHSEGCLEALNTYDSAFLSFGPFQQTVGAGTGEGELQGALYHIKNANAALFKKLFGNFKLDVASVKKIQNLDKGHFTLDGKELKSVADKEILRDFIWAYRCVKAMQNEGFRRLFLEYGFKRLEVVQAISAKVGGKEVLLGDVYRMEASLALLVDAHINLPALVDSSNGIWVKAAKSALNIGAADAIDPTTITRDQEYKMIAKIVELRNLSNMWDPAPRAAFILLCAKDLDDAVAKKFGYTDLDDLKTATGLENVKLAKEYMYGFLEHTR